MTLLMGSIHGLAQNNYYSQHNMPFLFLEVCFSGCDNTSTWLFIVAMYIIIFIILYIIIIGGGVLAHRSKCSYYTK
jgi:hypothetical protein